MEIGFDNDLYLKRQAENIRKRIDRFSGKLYLEFGGKLFDDYHAARVLPGFDKGVKLRLLQEFRDHAEIVFCINAGDIGAQKLRADFGITYEKDLLRQMDSMRDLGLLVSGVVITQYADQPAAAAFRTMLRNRGVKTYLHYSIPGYPTNVDFIASSEGFGRNDYIETERPLVVITAPGPCSGKLATCLSQLYHEYRRGIAAGYAKFETFPVWNLPLKHPVNIAYEAATADLKDVNMIDPYHLEAYGETTVNYNRDVEVFPVVRALLHRITGTDIYQSPTDMGVNMVGYGIMDDAIVCRAAEQEIIRRYLKAKCDYRQGRIDEETVARIEILMKQLGLKLEDRAVVLPAERRSEEIGVPVMAIELDDGKILTGKLSELMTPAAAALLNAMKVLAGLPDPLYLISPIVFEPIIKMKESALGLRRTMLTLDEMLTALSICAATNPMAERALSMLPKLRGCEAHSSHLLPKADELVLARLGIQLTSRDEFPSEDLYF